ncbi:MAG: sulfatase family protein [Planctomycetota bacterium]|jgi:arylsulfatase A-like enzyme
MADRPNILFIIPHDLGRFLNCYGFGKVKSPNLDKMAEEGVKFTNCFTTTAECSSSRAAMMTGLQPHQNGLIGLSSFGWSLNVPHCAQRLQDAGYATHHFGFQHEIHGSREDLGYQYPHQVDGSQADVVCSSICEFLNSDEAKGNKPWFIYAGFKNVHRAWPKATEVDPEDVDVPSWIPDNPVVRADLARFYQDITFMDKAVGTVLDTLKETGLDKDTLAVFTTDHGSAFPGAKATCYDPGIGIPLIMHKPGEIEGGISYDQLVSCTDITPTFLDIAEQEVPEEMTGKSLLPLLQNKKYEKYNYVSGGIFYDVAYDPIHYVRTDKYKYIKSFAVTEEDAGSADQGTLSTFSAGRWIRVDDFDVLTSPAWQSLKPDKPLPKPPSEELYDLTNDPDERNNLASVPEHREVLEEMRNLMQCMMEETNSPLLQGHILPSEKQSQASINYAPDSEKSLETIAERKELNDIQT